MKEKTVKREDLIKFAEILQILHQLPESEQLAIKYYLKGRIDATTSIVKIPLDCTT